MSLRAILLRLHGQPVARLQEESTPGRYVLAFEEDYVRLASLPTISLRFRDWRLGRIRRLPGLPPLLTNLLPEARSPFRRRVARAANLREDDDFGFLLALGQDMPGALTAHSGDIVALKPSIEDAPPPPRGQGIQLRHSLPGMQLKFSVDRTDRLVLPVDGLGGRWILKLPDRERPQLARAELAAMLWARACGFKVPTVEVIDPSEVEGLPEDAWRGLPEALLIRRFDRDEVGAPIHMEELAQALGVHPADKYCDEPGGPRFSLLHIALVLRDFTPPEDLITFVRRVVFDALVGNGDAHLKNWALIYPDRHHPRLAPAYDIVPTVLFGDNKLALPFAGGDAFSALNTNRLRQFAVKLKADPDQFEQIAAEVVGQALAAFRSAMEAAELPSDLVARLEAHHRALPLVRGG